jgi:predicted ATPase
VVDNFEQAVDHAAGTIARWLGDAPDATFLVTSRIALRIAGEHVAKVDPLDEESGVALFLARCRQTPPESEGPLVRELVARLDALPLAIELAAARTRMLPLRDVLARLDDRFRLLAVERRDLPPRQRSLRASLDASWELLPPWGRRGLSQLSVFEGAFALAAAESVLALDADAPWALDVIEILCDHSLLTANVEVSRFRMLVSVREYAAEQLAAEARAEAETRHVAWFASRWNSHAAHRAKTHPTEELPELLADADDLETAAHLALARRDGPRAATIALAVWIVLDRRGPLATAADLFDRVLAAELPAPARLGVALAACACRTNMGETELGTRTLEAALEAVRRDGQRDPAGEAVVLDVLASGHRTQGRTAQARTLYERAIASAREVGDRWTEARALGNLAAILLETGHPDDALAAFEGALALHRRVRNRRSEGLTLANLGILHLNQGRFDVARAHYDQALAIHREVGARRSEAIVLGNLGVLCHEVGKPEEAIGYYEQALAIHREIGNRPSEATVLGNLGNVLRSLERRDEALSAFEQAVTAHRAVGDRRSEGMVLGSLANLAAERGDFDEARALYDQALAAHRDVGDPRLEGVALANIAEFHRLTGDTAAARHAVDVAEGILAGVGATTERAKLACTRSRLLLGSGDADGARTELASARTLGGAASARVESDLGRRIAEVEGEIARATGGA